MQDEDKTTASAASDETSKHRNSSTMSSRNPTPQQSNRSGSTGRNLLDPLPLATVPSSESAMSSVSRRRLMRLSDKMNIVKRKAPPSNLPTSPLASPTRPSSRGRRPNGNQTPASSKAEEDDEEDEEESVLSEDYSQRSARVVGMISPVDSANNLRVMDEDSEDVATAQQRKTIEQVKSFLAQPGLANVPEEDRPDDEKKDAAEPNRKSFSPPQRHQRTAGGGAAKLMMVGPQKSAEEDLPTPRASPVSSAGSEKRSELQQSIDAARKQAKSQFNMQPTPNAASADETPVDLEAYRAKLALESPHLFDRTEVFHVTASDAMAALQSMRDFCPGGGDAQSVYSKASYGGTLLSHPSDAVSVAVSVTSAFQMGGGEGEESNFESLARRDTTAPLLSVRASHAVEALRHQMKDPNPTLAHLLQNIALPAEGDAPDLGATVRRKNACGALHVLTAQPTNRIPLAWTTGVLPALTSVLSDSGTEGVLVMYPEKRHRIEFETARNRAIFCLANLVTPKENRIPIFHSPDLIHWLVAVTLAGHGAARKGACTVLAYLAKTPENRLLMVQVPRLVEALTKVLKLRPPRVECVPSPRKHGSDSTHDSDDDDDTMTDRSEMTGSMGEMRSQGTHETPGVTKTESAMTEPSKFLSMSSSYSHQSGTTPRRDGGKNPIALEGYDETADRLLREARQFAFAALSNLAKEKDNAYHFARNTPLVTVMAEIAGFHESPSHEHAVKFLACLTRHRLNTKPLVFRRRTVVPALVNGTSSPSDLARLYACYALQNLSQDKSCRQELAIADNLLTSLCERARGATDQGGERLAALSSLKNLTDEPANLIPMSNTTDCIATLMHLAHGRQEGVTPLMQFRACDALATLSHWLRKIASSGQALTDAKMGAAKKELFVPTLRVVTVNQWQ